MRKILSSMLLVIFISISNIVYAAESLVGQVNGMMCIKCQKMVTEALTIVSPTATIKVSWPEGVAVSAFEDKSNLSNEDFKKAKDYQNSLKKSTLGINYTFSVLKKFLASSRQLSI